MTTPCLPSVQSIQAKAPTGDKHLLIDTSEMEHFDPTLAQLSGGRSRPGRAAEAGPPALTSAGMHPSPWGKHHKAPSSPLHKKPQRCNAADPPASCSEDGHSTEQYTLLIRSQRDAADWDATSRERSQSAPGLPLVSTVCSSSWNINPKSAPLAIISSCDCFFSPFVNKAALIFVHNMGCV